MENNYNQLKFNLSEKDFFDVQGYYEFKLHGFNYQKRLYLSYKVLKSPGLISLEDLMSEYFEKILLNGFLEVQSTHIYWREMAIKTPFKQFNYILPPNIRGRRDSALCDPSNVYKLKIHRNLYLKLYGIPMNLDSHLFKNFKNLFLNPLILEKSNCIIQLNEVPR